MIQGLAGWMSLTGEPDAPPTKTGLSLVDLSGGYVAAIALLGGLWRSRRDGSGCDCDISLFETALAELFYIGTWVATAGYVPNRHPESAHPSIVPFQNFRTSDGWIVVAAPKPKFWERLCGVLGLPQLADDARFASFAARDRNRDELVPILRDAFGCATTSEWLERLTAAGIPCGPINDVAAALEDPQVEARDGIAEIPHPRFGTVRQVATPLRLSGAEPPMRRGPRRGEDTAAVLAAVAGYDDERIAALARGGVFGDVDLESPVADAV
jgi:crotonobetainyl-CoA:carnitine CoA-transferase CaiB-like acyl-CoA transferase